MDHDKLTEAIMAEVDRLLAMSWNRFGNPDYCVTRLRLLAHLLIEAGDYETPERIVRDWRARYYRYAEHGGRGRFRDLLIPTTEDERAHVRGLRPGLQVDGVITRVCPTCRATAGRLCRPEDGNFHEDRYEAPDARDPLTGLTDRAALR